MVLVAIIRIAGIKFAGTVDTLWLAFWAQQECSIAVIMVSVIAFRSFFVAGAAAKRPPRLPIASQRIIRANNQLPTLDESEAIGLTDSRSVKTSTGSSLPIRPPRIPSLTLTNVRDSIGDAQSSSSRMAKSSSDNLRLSSDGVGDHFPPRPDGDSHATRREGLEVLAESQCPPRKNLSSSQNQPIGPSEIVFPDRDAELGYPNQTSAPMEHGQPSADKQSRWSRFSR